MTDHQHYASSRIFTLVIMMIASLLLGACATTNETTARYYDPSLPDNTGIYGYSPVSYFEKNTAEKGNANFSTTYKKKLYYFTSQQQLEKFKAKPDKFAPKYGQYCPYSLALGRKVAVDPTNFLIHNDELLLFHDEVELNATILENLESSLQEADRNSHLLMIDKDFN